MKSATTALIITVVTLAAMSANASASIITLSTPFDSSVDGQPVEAEATFTTGTDSITIVIANLHADPTSVVQNVSGLVFSLTSGETDATITSSAALMRSVDKNGGTYTDGIVAPTGWELGEIGDALHLHVLGTLAGPANTILGAPGSSGLYDNANGSIAGNKPHNPFLAETATFVLDVPGVTAESTILGATFEFGTSGDSITVGEPPLIPEPATLSLLAIGGLLVLNRRRRRG